MIDIPRCRKEPYIKNNFSELYESVINFSNKYNLNHLSWSVKLNHFRLDLRYIPTCLNCNSEVTYLGRKYKLYAKYCSEKCCGIFNIISADIKRKETLKKKYGEDIINIFQVDSIKKDIEKTNIEKYGVSNPNKCKETRDKIEKTNMERYGSKTYFYSDSYNSIIDDIRVKKYGQTHHMKNPEFLKEFLTNSELKYDGIGFASKEIRDKIEKTNLEKYGFINPFSSKEVQEKIKNINIEKYGDASFNKSSHSKEKVIETYRNKGVDIMWSHNDIYLSFCNKCDSNFQMSISMFKNRIKNNIPLCCNCYPINEFRSIKEVLIFDYVKTIYNGIVERKQVDGMEIDIFLPELNLGFEFNGIFWHSTRFKSNRYHIDKLINLNKNGIKLIHLWEDIYDLDSNIIFNLIKDELFKNINRRTLKIIEPPILEKIKHMEIYKEGKIEWS